MAQRGRRKDTTGRLDGVNVLIMDGSVHFITNRIPQMTWRALGTRNGGEPVGEIDY